VYPTIAEQLCTRNAKSREYKEDHKEEIARKNREYRERKRPERKI
jgi:hypothetical protein